RRVHSPHSPGRSRAAGSSSLSRFRTRSRGDRLVTDQPPSRPAIAAAAERLGPHLRVTPIWEWHDELWQQDLGHGTEVVLKLELFQHAGSFKPRGALTVML